jgi:sensor histidine kinase YesM
MIMKKKVSLILKKWNNLKLKPRLIILNFAIIIIITSIITTIILNYSKNIIRENSIVLIEDSISQINTNIDQMIKGQIYPVSKFIMYDEDIKEFLFIENDTKYIKSRQKEVDTYLIREKVLKQYFMQQQDMNLAAIINKNDVLYNLSFPAQDEKIVKQYINSMRENDITKDLNMMWYPLTRNIFTVQDKGDVRLNNVIVANRNIIKATTGRYLGHQLYTICEKSIYDTYKDSNIIKQGTLFIIDREGQLISHSDIEKVRSKDLRDVDKLIDKVLSSSNKSYYISEENKLIIQQPLNDGNWTTIAIMPKNSIYKNINRIYTLFFILIVSLLIVAGISITMISDRIVKPIVKIINSMEEVEKGNLNVCVDVNGQYEVSKLAIYYNNMISRINKLIEEEYVLEKKKKAAELDALMAQINPHFLYNTLESIVWKGRAIGSEEISEMAYSLGKFFRISVNRGKIIVPIEEELNHVQAYINIQKIRYGNKFDFIIELQNEHIKKYKTLKLILQPIVENSIMYGIEDLDGRGYIKIYISEETNRLIFTIEDNGVGINETRLAEINNRLSNLAEDHTISNEIKETKGIGLTNVNQRIKLYFGKEYGIRIDRKNDTGITVKIIVPIIRD